MLRAIVFCFSAFVGFFSYFVDTADCGLSVRGKRNLSDCKPPQIQCKVKIEQGPATWGSQTVLKSCWSVNELRGAAADKKIISLPAPDFTPPACVKPFHTLPPVQSTYRNVIRSIKLPAHKKAIALTFDLCELADRVSGYDFNIINFLRERSIHATFFMGGKWMRSHPEKAMQLIADPLFEIGNHAWAHGNFGVMSPSKIREQVQWTQSQYEILWNHLTTRALSRNVSKEEICRIPRIPKIFRLPYGRCSPTSLEILADEGLPVIQWDVVVAENASQYSPAQVAKAIARRVQPGSIILMHANAVPQKTSLILPELITVLQSQGYAFATVSELLHEGQPSAVIEGYFERPGDNLHYDHVYGDGTHRPTKTQDKSK